MSMGEPVGQRSRCWPQVEKWKSGKLEEVSTKCASTAGTSYLLVPLVPLLPLSHFLRRLFPTEQRLQLTLRHRRRLCQRLGQRVHRRRIELRAGVALQLHQGDGRGSRRTIRTRAGHGVERVGHVHDSRVEWNVVTEQAEWVAPAVGPLVMQLDDGEVRLEERHFPQDTRAE